MEINDDDFAEDLVSPSGFERIVDSENVEPYMEDQFLNPSKLFSFTNRQEMGFLDIASQNPGTSGSNPSSNQSDNNTSFSKSSASGWEETERNEGKRRTCDYRSKSCRTPFKVDTFLGKKEKLGERITALQQLVSPFGKTDTASVLHEATGYIRFLHDQVQVLSSPYLQRLPSSSRMTHEEDSRYDLRNRGLCLVPVEYTAHVANSNGADFWSPAMGNSSTFNSDH